ncbi:MAG: DUF4867 family protein [Faecalibacterium sp.]
MKLQTIQDPDFAAYGKVVEGYDNASIMQVLKESTPLPEGVVYVASEPALEALPVFAQLSSNQAGGMPMQMGYCNGHNTMLNCLEYHRDSEINLGATDFVALVAKQDEIIDGKLDTAKVKAFYVPAGVMVEFYATTLHYAPCSAKSGEGFQVLILLPRGTNGAKQNITALNDEDTWLFACNKWLLAHPESGESQNGAYVGLTGENINIASLI